MNSIHRRIITACCTLVVLGSGQTSRAGCCLTDWLFGKGQTTYTTPYCPTTVYAPPPQTCCAPSPCTTGNCGTYAPATTYRIAYRPVATVAYMPVTTTDPCSGCAVTAYRPTRTLTYYGRLVPYQVAYATPAYSSGGGCSSCCAAAPPSGYSVACPCTSVVPMGGCSPCSAGVSSGYVASGGCSSCSAGTTVLPGPAEMSQPPATTSPAPTLGAPAAAPGSPNEIPRTYVPSNTAPPVAPGAPTSAAPNRPSADARGYHLPTANDASHSIELPSIQGVPPMANGPQLTPTPAPRPEGSDRLTARPVQQAGYFQVLSSPPATVPARTVSHPSARTNLPADDGGWVHVDP